MTEPQFKLLLKLVTPLILHDPTHIQPITAEERLVLTLRILATGISQTAAAHSFAICQTTVGNIFKETTKAVYTDLKDAYIGEPSKDRWQQNAESFEAMWNFPNCIGAINGKHVQIKVQIIYKPKNGGSKWINYKRTHSVVLMAVARADYTFEYVDVGGFGRQSDGGTSQNCTLGRGFSDGELVLPTARKPPLCAKKVPYVFVADAAFPMSENLLRPYPGYASSSLAKQEHIFNYRLSRARRVVENALGIPAAKWEIFREPIALEPQQVIYLALACCALQNYLITENAKAGDNYISPTLVDSETLDGTFVPGSWRKTMPASMIALRVSGNRAGRAAIKTREDFSEHFGTHGSVPWQDNMVFGLLNK